MAIETIGLVAVTESASRKVAIKANGKVKAQAGTKYLLQVDGTDVAPGNLTVKRVGDDLQVSFEGSEEPDLTIQDFFAEGMDSQLYGVSEDGLLHAYVRTDGQGFYGKLLMMDGESAAIALGGEGAPYSAATIDDAAGFALWPLLLGLAGAGAATAAIIHHNRDDGKTKSKTSEAPTNLKATDDVGSIQGQLSNGDLTDDARPAVSGNGIPGATIHVLDNGVEIGSTTVQPDGTWTFTPELTDGVHTIEVIQAVAGAKPSEPIKVIDLIVDIVAPAVDASLNPESDSSTKGDGITNIKTPSFDGKAEPGATVEVTFATGEVVTVTADAKGEWSVTPTQPLPEGKNDITVIAVDSAGNRSASEVLTILIDSTASSAPRIDKVTDNDDPTKLIDVAKDGSTNDTTPVISGSDAEKGDIIHVFAGETELGSTIVKDDGSWSFEVPADKALTEGRHDLTVTSEDPAGNFSEQSQPFPLVIDLTAPDATTAQLAIDTVAGDDIVNSAESKVQQTISGKATGEFKAGDVVSFKLNGTTYSAAVA
ncbi:Ig-like domain-containing protein, partial [Pseudomonas sp. NPDC086581]|uniref:Ig-like domain-containing protein n=1 Tax=Pseudomonas sp. NPDC086581 TaxID=3364432 RepID=UPI00382C1C86